MQNKQQNGNGERVTSLSAPIAHKANQLIPVALCCVDSSGLCDWCPSNDGDKKICTTTDTRPQGFVSIGGVAHFLCHLYNCLTLVRRLVVCRGKFICISSDKVVVTSAQTARQAIAFVRAAQWEVRTIKRKTCIEWQTRNHHLGSFSFRWDGNETKKCESAYVNVICEVAVRDVFRNVLFFFSFRINGNIVHFVCECVFLQLKCEAANWC